MIVWFVLHCAVHCVDQKAESGDVEEGLVKAEAIKRSFVSFVLADHSKFDAVSATVFGQLRQACIITDELPDPSYQDITVVKEVLK